MASGFIQDRSKVELDVGKEIESSFHLTTSR
jgi:hypothetical protein